MSHSRLLFHLIVLVLLGCRQPDDTRPVDSPPKQPSASESRKVPGYSVKELSAIGSYLPDLLDEGRLQVAPPIGWHAAPRSKDYVARFRFDRNQPLPQITVEAREAGPDEPRNLNEENLPAYVDAMTDGMDEKLLQAMKGKIEPLKLGDLFCARYVVQRKFRSGGRLYAGKREVVQTIRNGRVYSVSLDVYAGMLVRYRADAYAVMATMKFPPAQQKDESDSKDRASEAGAKGDASENE